MVLRFAGIIGIINLVAPFEHELGILKLLEGSSHNFSKSGMHLFDTEDSFMPITELLLKAKVPVYQSVT
jgi:hypothetical protein